MDCSAAERAEKGGKGRKRAEKGGKGRKGPKWLAPRGRAAQCDMDAHDMGPGDRSRAAAPLSAT